MPRRLGSCTSRRNGARGSPHSIANSPKGVQERRRGGGLPQRHARIASRRPGRSPRRPSPVLGTSLLGSVARRPVASARGGRRRADRDASPSAGGALPLPAATTSLSLSALVHEASTRPEDRPRWEAEVRTLPHGRAARTISTVGSKNLPIRSAISNYGM